MAKYPSWPQPSAPAGGGPQLPRNPYAGAPGAALVGVGGSFIDVGRYRTMEAKEAEEKTLALERQTQLAEQTRTIAKSRTDFFRSLADEPDQERHEQMYHDYESRTLMSLEGIEDEVVRAAATSYASQQLAAVYDDVRTGRWDKRLQRADKEIQLGLQAAIDNRDAQPYTDYLNQLAEQDVINQHEADLRIALARRQVGQAVQMDRLRARIEYLPTTAARQVLNDPQTWKELDLTAEERSTYRAELTARLAARQALEADLAARVEAQREAADNQLLDDALSHKLSPEQIKAIPALIGSGKISAKVGQEALVIVTKPPTENDPDIAAQAYELVADVDAGRVDKKKALSQLNTWASKLTPTFRDARIRDLTDTSTIGAALKDASRRARAELLLVEDEARFFALLAAFKDEETARSLREQRAVEIRLVNYHDEQLRQWHRSHPEVESEQIYTESLRILRHLRPMGDAERRSLLEAWEARLLAPPAPPATRSGRPPGDETAALMPVWDPQTGKVDLSLFASLPAPAGLEEVWDRLNDEEKGTALQALRRGFSAQEILEALQEGSQ